MEANSGEVVVHHRGRRYKRPSIPLGPSSLEHNLPPLHTKGKSKSSWPYLKQSLKPLPSIGTTLCIDTNISMSSSANESNANHHGCDLSSDTLPSEPDLYSPNSVTLCIKLPNCERIQRRFNYKTHCIKDVIHFACLSLNHGSIDFDEICLSDSEMCHFSDYSKTLCQVGLTHNTVLHLSYR